MSYKNKKKKTLIFFLQIALLQKQKKKILLIKFCLSIVVQIRGWLIGTVYKQMQFICTFFNNKNRK